ncbi:MAG: N-acetylmuramoyl-L-alanine amidase [Butyrivibrio sp.]|nr:N-acetylmuramoyl-L-alanine amidase [Butyrivibrio sp.]
MKRQGMLIVFAAALSLCLGALHETVRAKDADGDVVIVIDAGHGGQDPGSEALTGAYEKDCNLEIALAMKEELGKYKGVKVYLTRSDDEWLTNTGRAMVAASLKADFLISVHNNSGSATSSGCIGYRSLNKYYSEATNEMCSLITDNLAALGLHNGGVQTRESTQYAGEDYYTLIGEGVRAGIPSVIIEHCFLSNSEDAAFLTNADKTVNKENARKMGVADANAVVTYFGLSRRTAAADSQSSVTLQKGSSVTLSIPNYAGADATWYSIDQNTATVDGNGTATAVGTGTTNIVYKLADGTTGYCTVKVEPPTAVTLTGCIDPTFYENMTEFGAMNLADAFGFVSYSDGSSLKTAVEITGSLDKAKIGIQDIEIKYGELTGLLRVCNASSPYVPEVTLPEPTDAPKPSETASENSEPTDASSVDRTDAESASGPNQPSDGKEDISGKLVKYIVVLLAVVVLGIILFVLENGRRRKRGNRSRRSSGRRYR